MRQPSRATLIAVVTPVAVVAALAATAAHAAPQRTPGPGDLRLATGVVINEIMFDPVGRDAGNEWLELFNGGRAPVSLAGWVVATSSRPRAAELPDWSLPPGAYLTVRFGRAPQDSDFSDGAGTFATGGSRAVFRNNRNGVALYRCAPSPACVVDYVAWGFGRRFRAPRTEADAVAAGIWTAGERFRSGLFATEGQSLGRNGQSADGDSQLDWEGWGGIEATGPTPGAANFSELGYQTQASNPCRAGPLQLDAAARSRFEAQVLAALRQIRGRLRELFPGLDPGLGDGEPRVLPNGDIVIGSVVIRAGRNLNPDPEGPKGAGLTCPPDSFRGTTRVYIDVDTERALWQIKEILYHELVHVAIFRDAGSGYWLPPRDRPVAAPENVRGLARPTHEAVAYVLDLRLLESLLIEFRAQQADIRTRMSKKVQYMEFFLQQALDNRGRLTNPFFRDFLRRLIDSRLREFLVWKVWQARLDERVSRRESRDIRRVGGLLGLDDAALRRMLRRGCQDRVSFVCADPECGGGVCCRDEVTPPEEVACEDLEDPCRPGCPFAPPECRELQTQTCTNECPGGTCCADANPPPGAIPCSQICVPGTPWCP